MSARPDPHRSVTAVADLHGDLPERLPGADLLLIAGDVCPIADHSLDFQARWLERDFYPWLDRQPHDEIAWIAGNHDFICQQPGWRPGGRGRYLLDEAVELAGLSIYGTPWVPDLVGWAFHATDEELEALLGSIPPIDVVLAHGPPRGFGDRTVSGAEVGAPALAERLRRAPPKLCVFGHIHEAWGLWRSQETVLANVSWVDETYSPRPNAARRFLVGTGGVEVEGAAG